MKKTSRWYSERLERDVLLARWGDYGTPVLLFPTAGGDAEEVERFHMMDVLDPLISTGRAKVYSCDSVAGRAMLTQEGSVAHRMWVLKQFQEFVRHEVVPAIRMDCRSPDIEIIATGASLGAFNSLSAICRFPDVFSHAICMSGTYNMQRFLDGDFTEDFYFASPLHFLPGLEGEMLERLRTRFILLASGEGRAEDIGESWRVAHVLGQKGVPNRVDSWGADWAHDWPTWRRMLPQYLGEFLPA